MLSLKIIPAPPDYINASYAYMRSRENAAGREEHGFVVIDAEAAEQDAVWYVSHFADPFDVEVGEAASTDVVMKILIKTSCLALAWVNYEVGNGSVSEDLGHAGVAKPLVNDFVQESAWDCGSVNTGCHRWHQAVRVVAGPGEFETTDAWEVVRGFIPRVEVVGRVTEEAGREVGVLPRWMVVGDVAGVRREDGEEGFVEGSVALVQVFDPEFAWPEYKWPEGSL